MAKIKVKTLSEELREIFSENPETLEKINMLKAWPVIVGPQLSAVSELISATDGVLGVFVNSPASKSLLLLKKEQIISKFNKMFPDAKIKRIQIVKRA